jgi:hypothetical protein
MAMHTSDIAEEFDSQLQPVLDQALTELKPEDRDALILRFLERSDLARVGQLLGISEDAAQKRISRALDRLRGILSARGVTVSAAALAVFCARQSIAVPSALSQAVASGAIAGVSSIAGIVAGTKLKLAGSPPLYRASSTAASPYPDG